MPLRHGIKSRGGQPFYRRALRCVSRTAILSQPLYYYRNNPDSVTNKYDENSKAVTDAYLEKIRRFTDEKLSGDKKITEYFTVTGAILR